MAHKHMRIGIEAFVLCAVLFCGLSALGIWQWQRAIEKSVVLAAFAAAHEQEPSVLSPQSELGNMPYQRVRVTGTYDTTRQFLLDNRTVDGINGFAVLTPLRLDAQTVVLTDRGWTPRRWQETPPFGPIDASEAVATYTGMLVPPVLPLALGDVTYDTEWPKIIQRTDIRTLGDMLPYTVLPAVFIPDYADAPLFRVPYVPVTITPARHRAYAATWFVLAVCVLILCCGAYRKQQVGFYGNRKNNEKNDVDKYV